jgi:cytoskeletal protein CcmA (bactofilin family)
MGLNGNSTLNNRGEIDGNVYNFGDLWVNGRAVPNIDGDVLALDGRNIDVTQISGNDKIEMEIQSSEWDFSVAGTAPTYITTNVVETVGGLTVTNTYKYLDLTDGKTVKVVGDYDLPNDVDGTTGDGTLIVDSGDLKFPTVTGSSYTIGAGATIMVDGNMVAKKEGTFEDGVTVYVNGDMDLSKTGTGSTVSVFVEGDLTVDMDLNFSGLLFVDGFTQVDGNLDLNGSLISGEGFWLKKDYDIDYDASVIDQDLLDQMILYVIYATSPGTWNELPSS